MLRALIVAHAISVLGMAQAEEKCGGSAKISINGNALRSYATISEAIQNSNEHDEILISSVVSHENVTINNRNVNAPSSTASA